MNKKGKFPTKFGNPRTGIFPHGCIFETCFWLAYYNVLNVAGCAEPKVGLEELDKKYFNSTNAFIVCCNVCLKKLKLFKCV